MGPITELETQMIINNELEYIDNEVANVLVAEIGEVQRMINAFRIKYESDYIKKVTSLASINLESRI